MNKDDTISAYRDFTEWCKENPSFDLDVRLHTHSGRIGDGGYISDETTRIAFAAWRAAIKADRQKRIEPELARDQPCGCVVCSCKNQAQCLGCGAKHCGSHEVGEIPNPVYVDHIADAGEMVSLRDQFAMAALQGVMANPGGPIQANGMSGWGWCNCSASDVANFVYSVADTMLKEQSK